MHDTSWQQGFSAVKFGWPPFGLDADHDEAIVRTLRDAVGPSVDLLIDGGMAWDLPAAHRSRRTAAEVQPVLAGGAVSCL